MNNKENCVYSKLAEIDYAKDVLEANGYFVRNLWNVQDVKTFYKCTDAEAMKVLDHVLNGNDFITSTVWDMIDIVANEMELEKKDEISNL